MKKRITAVLLAMVMLTSILPISAMGTDVLVDVPAGAYYADAVTWAVKEGIITTETSGTTFSPNAFCTRAQTVTFLWRYAGAPEVNKTSTFTDVPAGAYYADAVAWALENKITTGTTATTFSPNDTCTRAQIVTFLRRYAREKATINNNIFSDVASDAYYYDAVEWAIIRYITTGTSNTTFSPNDTCTHAQIITFLWRYAGRPGMQFPLTTRNSDGYFLYEDGSVHICYSSRCVPHYFYKTVVTRPTIYGNEAYTEMEQKYVRDHSLSDIRVWNNDDGSMNVYDLDGNLIRTCKDQDDFESFLGHYEEVPVTKYRRIVLHNAIVRKNLYTWDEQCLECGRISPTKLGWVTIGETYETDEFVPGIDEIPQLEMYEKAEDYTESCTCHEKQYVLRYPNYPY